MNAVDFVLWASYHFEKSGLNTKLTGEAGVDGRANCLGNKR